MEVIYIRVCVYVHTIYAEEISYLLSFQFHVGSLYYEARTYDCMTGISNIS